MLHCTLHLGRKAHFDGIKHPNAAVSAAGFTSKAVFSLLCATLSIELKKKKKAA